MKNKRLGFAITGSFCTLQPILPVIKELAENNNFVLPILSYSVAETDTRFYKAKDFIKDVEAQAKIKPILTIAEAEPIGPKKALDLLIIAPCTGNTLAKLNNAITDTPVLMAAKAHLRNNRPVLIAVSTNDALSNNFCNIGSLLNKKNVFFVPFKQDDCLGKPFSLVADFSLIKEAAHAALEGKQLQPIVRG
jgi:dipicolinate synthase subunit B